MLHSATRLSTDPKQQKNTHNPNSLRVRNFPKAFIGKYQQSQIWKERD